MNKLITILVTGSAMAMGTTSANAATASAAAEAEVLEQVQILNTSNLNFGSIVSDTTSEATVTMAAGAGGVINCGILTCADAGNLSAAAFDVSGAKGLSVDITVGALTQIVDDNANTLAILLGTSANTLTFVDGSAVPLYIGATITVPANHPVGSYTAEFDVTAEYQ